MISGKFLDNLSPEDTDRLLQDLLKKRSPDELVNARDSRTGLTHISEHIEAAQEKIANWGKVQGLSSGYPSIDQLTMGLLPGELVIVAGPTSFGKTTLAVNMAHHMAVAGVPVMFITLEMTHPEIVSRIMKIAEPEPVDKLPINFQLSESIDWRDIPTLVKKAAAEGAQVVFADYLQYLARGSDVTGEIGKITQAFKRAAIRYKVPVVLLSQLRRINDRVEGKKREAELSDLKESSYIEQDADIVLMITRQEGLIAGEFEMIIKKLKNRNRSGKDQAILEVDGIKLREERI